MLETATLGVTDLSHGFFHELVIGRVRKLTVSKLQKFYYTRLQNQRMPNNRKSTGLWPYFVDRIAHNTIQCHATEMLLLMGNGVKSAEVMVRNLLNDLHFFPYVTKCS